MLNSIMELFDSIIEWIESLGMRKEYYALTLGLSALGYWMKIGDKEVAQQRVNEMLKDGYGCPSCFEEYESHIEVCPDCNAKIMQYKDMMSS